MLSNHLTSQETGGPTCHGVIVSSKGYGRFCRRAIQAPGPIQNCGPAHCTLRGGGVDVPSRLRPFHFAMSDSYNVNALEPGTMIQEFKVLRILGAGSFGIVYLAENVYFPEKVAIKECLPSQLAQRADGSTVVPTSSGTQEAYQWALDKFVK